MSMRKHNKYLWSGTSPARNTIQWRYLARTSPVVQGTLTEHAEVGALSISASGCLPEHIGQVCKIVGSMSFTQKK